MNREIKFRAWDKNAIAMQYRTLAEYGEKGFGLPYPEDPEIIVMQFTGLKDRNGKEIYEGDILQIFNEKYEVRVIQTENQMFVDYGYPNKHNGPAPHWVEIIGNAYENPKLLKH